MGTYIYIYPPEAISDYLYSDDIQIMPLQAPYCSDCVAR